MSDSDDLPAVASDQASSDESAGTDTQDIAGYTRLGPGSIESLRFKWTVRQEGNGYFVDETIGASQSPVSRGPMSHEIAMDFIEARYRDASARFEHRRDRLANAPSRPRRASPVSQPPPLPVEMESPAVADPVSVSAEPEQTGLAQAMLAAAAKADSGKAEKDGGQRVDLEDVMKRISRLLDER
jgi:hypothetical protein